MRDIVIGAVFGAGPSLDAYLVAQGVMNIVLGLIAGATARSLTPVLARQATDCQHDGQPRCRGHRTADVTVTVTMIVLGLAGVLMAIFAAQVVTVLAPGFGPAESELTQRLTRVVLIATVLVAGTNLLAGVAHAHGRFGWAAAQGVPFNLVMIVAAAWFGPRYGVVSLAIGFVVGSAARLLLQVLPLRRLGMRVRPRIDLRDPGFRAVARMLPPLLLASAVTNVNQLVDRAVASTLSEGAITALSYGWRVVNLPETIIVASLLVPLYPAIGASGADEIERRRLLRRGISAVVTTLVPVTIVLAIAAEPVVSTLFGYGAFDAAAVATTSSALQWYAVGLLALGISTMFLRACHAVGDARGPVIASVIAMVVNVVGDLVLGPVYGVPGIAFATTASLAVAAVLNGWWLVRRHRAVDLPHLGGVLARAVAGSAVALAAGWAVTAAVPDGWPPVLRAGLIAGAVLAGYCAVLVVLRAPELGLVREVAGDLRRRRSRSNES